MRQAASRLVDEFYPAENRDTPAKLVLEHDRLHNGGDDYMLVKEMSTEQKAGLPERLPTYQAEIARFAAFLKLKFLDGELAKAQDPMAP